MKRLHNILIIFLFASSAASGQDVKVTAAFDSSKIYIGDQIYFTLKVDQPSEIGLRFPFFRDTLCKNIEIISGPDVDSIVGIDGRLSITEKYLITSFDSGYYELPPVFAEHRSEGGLKRFYSEYTQLAVMRLNVAPADTAATIYDIIKPYKAPLTPGEILPWVLLVIAAGIIVWIVIRLIRRFRKSKPDYTPEIIIEPAHIIAFRELEMIKNEELWQKGETKHYYTRLTEILRQYLENRYRVYSLELTTSETLNALIKSGFKKDDSYNKLKSVLTGADLVKFAKYNPDAQENEVNFTNSWEFVDVTKATDQAITGTDSSGKEGEVKA